MMRHMHIRVPVVVLSVIATAVFASFVMSARKDEGPMPGLDGAVWLNSGPLNNRALRGKVVLVDFCARNVSSRPSALRETHGRRTALPLDSTSINGD